MKKKAAPHVTFGKVQAKAIKAGLIMSRRPAGVTVRPRSQNGGGQVWAGMTVTEALEIVEQQARRRG